MGSLSAHDDHATASKLLDLQVRGSRASVVASVVVCVCVPLSVNPTVVLCSLLCIDQAKIVDVQAKLADTTDVSARQALVDKIEGYHGMSGCFESSLCALWH